MLNDDPPAWIDEPPPPESDEPPLGLNETEAERILAALIPPGAPDMTDVGNGERLAERYAGNFRYVLAWDKWIAWDGNRWRIHAILDAQKLAAEIGHELETEARQAPASDPAVKRALVARAQRAKSYQGIVNAVKLSATNPAVRIEHERLDNQPAMLPCANGLVTLFDGELVPHSREMFYTRGSPVAYDPAAECPRWLQFLGEIFDTDVELIDFMQRAVGYTLTGESSEQCLFFLHGGGRNGKSTFVETIMSLLGELAAPAPRNFLELRANEGHETSLTVLFGRRAISVPETNQGRCWDETLIKQLTGGDTISARRMREDHWSFKPTHKLWVHGNHKPTIRGTDDGIWRRIPLVPFTTQIAADAVDPDLRDKLRAELPGILAWAVRGAVEWYDGGLRIPERVIVASKKYRAEQDMHGQFIDEVCIQEPGAWCAVSALRNEYVSWCKENGVEPLGARQFNERLREREGVSESDRRAGLEKKTKGWSGIRLRLGVDPAPGDRGLGF